MDKLTVKELKQLAKSTGISGYSKMTKIDLIESLNQAGGAELAVRNQDFPEELYNLYHITIYGINNDRNRSLVRIFLIAAENETVAMEIMNRDMRFTGPEEEYAEYKININLVENIYITDEDLNNDIEDSNMLSVHNGHNR